MIICYTVSQIYRFHVLLVYLRMILTRFLHGCGRMSRSVLVNDVGLVVVENLNAYFIKTVAFY